ncbi:MAG: hypothetical protein KDI18_01420 [Gammaproteobacteria bacterium]|nr:hypothetical protein [Gammaproteobacteria bacterium]
MTHLNFLNGQQDLFHLVGFSLAFVVLNVYSGVARPGGFENAVAATALTGLPKVVFADLFQITKPNPFGIRLHLIDDFCNASHMQKISLLILLARTMRAIT